MTWDHSEKTERQWDNVDYMLGAFLGLLVVMLVVAWLLSSVTDSFAGFTEEREDETTETVVVELQGEVGSPSIIAPTRLSDSDLRTLWAQRLVERRQDASIQNVADAGRGTTTHVADTVVASPPTVAVVANVAHWHPSDECSRVPRHYINDRVIAHCPLVADHLAQWNWQPGDLTFILTVQMCESRGSHTANEVNYGTGPRAVWGLHSHRREFWAGRSLLALGRPGVIDSFHDDVAVAIWLWKSGHQKWENSWDGCADRIRANL